MSTYNILVIEDDEIVARTIERSLRSQDFKVTIARSGVEGLKLARSLGPDLVILDVIMPGMDGYTVCREMRLDIRLSDVPVLFLTAKIKDEDKITGFKAGADDYLSKPSTLMSSSYGCAQSFDVPEAQPTNLLLVRSLLSIKLS